VSERDPRDEILDHLPALRAFAMSLTRNTHSADDLVQDTIVKAFSNFEKFETGSNMRAWLFTILRNTHYSHLRKHRREVEDPDGAIAERQAHMPDHDARLAVSDFMAAFATLPLEQREALALIGVAGFSYEEAAEMCGHPVGTIKSRVNRARAKLAQMLDIEDESDLNLTDRAALGGLPSGGSGR